MSFRKLMEARKLSRISCPLLDLHHGGVLVFRKGESTEQYPHTGCFVSTQRYQPEGFVSTEGYPHLKLPLPFMCLTDNRKGENLRAVSCDSISLASKALKTTIVIIPGKIEVTYIVQASRYRILLSNKYTASSIQ